MSKLKEFIDKRKEILNDKPNQEVQHKKDKMTARERLKYLLDEDTFLEIGAFAELNNEGLKDKKKAGDGVITGHGMIGKKQVYVYAQDFSFMGGSMGEMHNKKIAHVMELALKTGCPIIGLLDSGGARIQEGVSALDAGGAIFQLNTLSSGTIPQISAIMGPCAGIAVYSPALTDFILMVKKKSYMFITGPDVIKSVTGEEIDFEGLGGSTAHCEKSGVAHFAADDEKECLDIIKALLTYLPQNNLESPPYFMGNDSVTRETKKLETIVPEDQKKAYDIIDAIEEIFDKKSLLEVQPNYASNAVIGFARLNGNVVGIVANQPKVLAGCLDINSSDKIARFVRFCDCFNMPIINLVDVTGYLPGTNQEHSGIIRHGAKILFAYSEATVPKISLVMRKAYGGAYIALVSKDMGYDKVIAWPNAEIAVMGAEQAVNIVNRKELAEKNSDKRKKELVDEYSEKYLNPYVSAKLGKVDMIIEPKETRTTLIKCLEMLLSKREKRMPKKHANIPL
ncbi:MAG TPA: acyl-CoA carboxylase subunit beta [Candidatus Nanoarchaeia archaeon]|nr:acyl-CoA carboxylase subunit beta [Candidatus Nanoarchaeia archaeon]